MYRVASHLINGYALVRSCVGVPVAPVDLRLQPRLGGHSPISWSGQPLDSRWGFELNI